MSGPETRTKILDAAEQLFAVKGVGGTSLRAIVTEADVNLAAIHYHFGSKTALALALFSRRLDPIIHEQHQRLAKCEEAGCYLEDVLGAFVSPILALRGDNDKGTAAFLRVLGNTYVEPDEELFHVIHERFGDAVGHFACALRKAVPELPEQVFQARLLFAFGALSFSLGDAAKRMVPGAQEIPADITARNLVLFLTVGFKAPY